MDAIDVGLAEIQKRNRDLLSEDRPWSSMALLARSFRSLLLPCTVSYSKSIVGAAFMAVSSVRVRRSVERERRAGVIRKRSTWDEGFLEWIR